MRDRPCTTSNELGEAGGGPSGAVGLDGPVAYWARDFRGYRRGERFRLGLLIVHVPAGAVLGQPVPDMEVLLEVMAQRYVDEGTLARGEFHGGGQAALHHPEVACREVPVKVMHVPVHLKTAVRRQTGRIDPRAGHHDHPQLWHEP